MDQPTASMKTLGEEPAAVIDLSEKSVDGDVHMGEAVESIEAERSVSGVAKRSSEVIHNEPPMQVYLPPELGAPAFSVTTPPRRPIAYDEYEMDNGSSRIAYLRSVLPTQPVPVPPPMQYRMPTSGGDAHFNDEERRRVALKADAKRKELRAASVLLYTIDFKKALEEYLQQHGIQLEVDDYSVNRGEMMEKGLPYRCVVWWYQQPNGGGRIDFDGGYQSDYRLALQAAAHAAITLKGIPLDDLLEKNSSNYGNSVIPATTARLKDVLKEGGDEGKEIITFTEAQREVQDGDELHKEYQYTAKVAGWGGEDTAEFTGGWHASAMDAKNDSCQKVWSEIDAKERAKREEEEAERMAKEREARMKEQLEKDKEIKERLAKEKEREREARIKAAPVRMSAVAASYSEKRQLGQTGGGPDKRPRVAASYEQQHQQQMPQGGSMLRREPVQQQQQGTHRPYPSPAPPYQQRSYAHHNQQQQQQQISNRPPMHSVPQHQTPTAQPAVGASMNRASFGSYGSSSPAPPASTAGGPWQQQQGATMMATATPAVGGAYQSRNPLPPQPYPQSSVADMAARAAQMSAAASYYGQQTVKQQPGMASYATTAATGGGTTQPFGRHAAVSSTSYAQQLPPAATALNAGQYMTGSQYSSGLTQQQQQYKSVQSSGGLGVYGGAASSSGPQTAMPMYTGIYGQQQQQARTPTPGPSAQPATAAAAAGGGQAPYAGQAVKATSSLEEYAAALATYQKQMAEYAAKCSAYYAQQQQQQRQ